MKIFFRWVLNILRITYGQPGSGAQCHALRAYLEMNMSIVFRTSSFPWPVFMLSQNFECTVMILLEYMTVFEQVMHHFTSTVCNELDALPLAKEAAATASHQAKTWACSQTHAQSCARSLSQNRKHSKSPQSKKFNMFTFKWHTLGHYPSIVWHYGTLDLLGTHIVYVLISWTTGIFSSGCRERLNTSRSSDSIRGPTRTNTNTRLQNMNSDSHGWDI